MKHLMIFVLLCSLSIFSQAQSFREVWQKGASANDMEKTDVAEKAYKPGDLIPVLNEHKLWGYEQYGELVIAHKYQEAGDFVDGMAPVMLNGKYGYIDRTGKCVIPYKFDFAGDFSESLARVCLNRKWGYVDKIGSLVIPYKYFSAGDFSEGLAAVSFDGRDGFVDKEDKWFDSRLEAKKSFAVFARAFVEAKINEWQRKGKYEKTDAWLARVNDSTRSVMIDSLFVISQERYIDFHDDYVSNAYSLGAYDADGEIFMVQDEQFGNMLVPVPISEAEYFEINFGSVKRENRYCIENDGLGLASAVFTCPNGKQYSYSNKVSLAFASVDIEYNFEKVDFDATPVEEFRAEQKIRKNSISVGKSDVDVNIPETDFVNEKTFAVIIANENYKREASVEFAVNDGSAFSSYCRKTLGIPEKNIRFSADATLGDMMGQVDWITNIAKAYGGEANIIFYYAGHGIPDEASKDAYLLPVDGYGTNVATGYKLGTLYSRLSEYPTASSLVLLDACFSGAKRDGDMMVAARGIAIKAKAEQPKGNMVVFSAAQGDETAYPYNEKGHGMFTYFLLKKLQETHGNVTLGELASFVTDEVGKRSIIENSKSQTPSVMAGLNDEMWKNLRLR